MIENYPALGSVCPRCQKPLIVTGMMEGCNCRIGSRLPIKLEIPKTVLPTPPANALKYPAYFRPVSHLTHVDVYAVHQLFGVNDPSGAIQHASKKLLLSGVRTGGKSAYDDVREARDTLNRYLEMHDAMVQKPV